MIRDVIPDADSGSTKPGTSRSAEFARCVDGFGIAADGEMVPRLQVVGNDGTGPEP